MSHASDATAARIDRAIAAIRAGEPVCVHDADDREGETDLIYPAAAVDPEAVARMRNDAGGLICVALSAEVADAFELPFMHEALDHPTTDGDPDYDDRSSFSIPVNHRETFTGITDDDRALTIRRLAAAAADPEETDFAAEFRTPGHVPLLRAADSLLAERRGHTELGIALARAADREPAVVVSEMLDDESGAALPKDAAREYAAANDIPYLEGARVVERLG